MSCPSRLVPLEAPRARADRLRVRADQREARARAQRRRAGDVLAPLVRALRLQALAKAPRPPADRGAARRDGPGRERRRGGCRRRLRGRIQGRVAQPPFGGRAVPGRGDRRRRNPARRLRPGRTADRDPRLASLRRPLLGALALPLRPRRRRHRPLRQLDRRPHGRRRGLLRASLRAELPGERDVHRLREDRLDGPLPRPRASATRSS